MAIAQGTLFLLAGAIAVRFPTTGSRTAASPSSVPRPAIGSSTSATRRRRDERIALMAVALPLTGGAVLIAFLADGPIARLVAGSAAVIGVLWFGGGTLVATAPGSFWDPDRTRLYERTVARAAERRSRSGGARRSGGRSDQGAPHRDVHPVHAPLPTRPPARPHTRTPGQRAGCPPSGRSASLSRSASSRRSSAGRGGASTVTSVAHHLVEVAAVDPLDGFGNRRLPLGSAQRAVGEGDVARRFRGRGRPGQRVLVGRRPDRGQPGTAVTTADDHPRYDERRLGGGDRGIEGETAERHETGTGRRPIQFGGDLQVRHEIVEPLRRLVQAARFVAGHLAPADHAVAVPHPCVRVLRWQQRQQGPRI